MRQRFFPTLFDLPSTWLTGFILRRQAPTDSLRLTQRNVYILPTRPGLMLGATLLLLLLTAINYQLNLGYLVTFLLLGSAVVGMHIAHATLRGLVLSVQPPSACFAQQDTLLTVRLSSERRRVRYGIGVRIFERTQAPAHWVWTDVPGQNSSTVQVAFTPAQRGINPLPALSAETRFPLGTFRVWTIWRPAATVLAYPSPELPTPPLPYAQGYEGDRNNVSSRSQSSEEFDSIRPYRRGDSLRQVLWKQAAKSADFSLLVRQSAVLQSDELWLDIHHTGLPESVGSEMQLSRLCAWVLEAQRLGLRYGLRLKNQSFAPDQGEAHQSRCLEALALYGLQI